MGKAFISKNNPFNEDAADGECFSYSYLLPKYWISWILIFLSFPTGILTKDHQIISWINVREDVISN